MGGGRTSFAACQEAARQIPAGLSTSCQKTRSLIHAVYSKKVIVGNQ